MHRTAIVLALFSVVLTAAPRRARAQEGLARAAALVKDNKAAKTAGELLRRYAVQIRSPQIRAVTLDLLGNPAPGFMVKWPDAAAREEARKALVASGFLAADVPLAELFPPLPDPKKAPQPYELAPAGTPDHHHGYPGGLPVHAAFNLQSALDLERNYVKSYGVTLDRDLLIAGAVLHDAMKSWTFQWQRDGQISRQPRLADTGSHHIFIVAEALHRGLPPRLVLTLASAHDAPMDDTAPRVVAYLRAAAILAKVDASALGLLVRDGKGAWSLAQPPPLEATINHLADHDYVFTDPAAAIEAAALDRIALAAAKEEGVTLDKTRLTWLRHRIHQRIPSVQIYTWLTDGGDAAIASGMRARGMKPIEPADLAP